MLQVYCMDSSLGVRQLGRGANAHKKTLTPKPWTLGIVIDAFGGLKEEREAAEDDLAANCFVCNLDRFQVRHLDRMSRI